MNVFKYQYTILVLALIIVLIVSNFSTPGHQWVKTYSGYNINEIYYEEVKPRFNTLKITSDIMINWTNVDLAKDIVKDYMRKYYGWKDIVRINILYHKIPVISADEPYQSPIVVLSVENSSNWRAYVAVDLGVQEVIGVGKITKIYVYSGPFTIIRKTRSKCTLLLNNTYHKLRSNPSLAEKFVEKSLVYYSPNLMKPILDRDDVEISIISVRVYDNYVFFSYTLKIKGYVIEADITPLPVFPIAPHIGLGVVLYNPCTNTTLFLLPPSNILYMIMNNRVYISGNITDLKRIIEKVIDKARLEVELQNIRLAHNYTCFYNEYDVRKALVPIDLDNDALPDALISSYVITVNCTPLNMTYVVDTMFGEIHEIEQSTRYFRYFQLVLMLSLRFPVVFTPGTYFHTGDPRGNYW